MLFECLYLFELILFVPIDFFYFTIIACLLPAFLLDTSPQFAAVLCTHGQHNFLHSSVQETISKVRNNTIIGLVSYMIM